MQSCCCCVYVIIVAAVVLLLLLFVVLKISESHLQYGFLLLNYYVALSLISNI